MTSTETRHDREQSKSHASGRRRLRRIGAVLSGLVTVILITTATDALLHATGVFPPTGQPMAEALFVLATAYRIVYGVIGGYVTARLAPDRPLRHAVVLGVLGLAASVAGTVATWNAGPAFGPKWYPLTLIVTAVPSTWAGGKLAEHARASQTH